MDEPKSITREEMHSWPNLFWHGVYLLFYGMIKNWSFPFSNYFRYAVLKIFCRNLSSKYISDGVTIWFPWNLKMGKRSSLNQGVIVNATGGVEIGEGVRIAAYTCINSVDHDFSNREKFIVEQGFIPGKIVIEDDVWIGSGVHINKGIRIGKGSVIGSGSVVTKDIPPYSIAAGVPCKVIKER